MGVPAFFKWLLEKYPKTVQDMLERRQAVVDGVAIPLDLNEPNPNDVEYDNLYVDMNGLIHPCSHPEDRDAPTSEFEMYVNVTKYVDRLFAAVRPRRLLFLAIDGVAPRAKMNQQRSRRFRSAQDAKERAEALQEVVEEMRIMGLSPPDSRGPEWDSNVITPGTEFMSGLSTYLRFYILDRMNRDPAWRNIEVILSDASVPGEGEHKVMSFIRHQRAQPGYDPNQRHVLHGLDADLIMLALATHEAHFTILREEVTFGGRGKNNQKSDAKRMIEEMNNREGAAISSLHPEDEWVYSKPLQRLNIAVLREYLSGEFSSLRVDGLLPFEFDLERIIDDFVFLCFFVGNDFLPHLPSLDIRDGALDFLMESYKDLLPSMGDYITAPGGVVNLRQVDIILGRVGQVEDIVFQRKKAREDFEDAKRARNNVRKKAGGYDKQSGQTLLDNIRNNTVSANSTFANKDVEKIALVPLGAVAPPPLPPNSAAPSQAYGAQSNASAAQALRAKFGGSSSTAAASANVLMDVESAELPVAAELGKRVSSDMSLSGDVEEVEADFGNPAKVLKQDLEGDVTMQPATATMSETDLLGAPEMDTDSDEGDVDINIDYAAVGAVNDAGDEIKRRNLASHYKQFMNGDTAAEAREIVKSRLKSKENERVDKKRATVQDDIKLHETGWKDRYYGDNYKKKDLEQGGGLKEMCHHYIKGLLWVFKYYYEGCVSWSWFYPFHYAPFASDLINVDSYVIEFELAEPFHPFEQLLSVLPSESAHCLPEACSWLMTDSDSPIIDIYNSDIPIDPNGKPLPWLWVLLIPFIEENRVRQAMSKCAPNLTREEARRNAWGPMFMFLHKNNKVATHALTAMEYKPVIDGPDILTGDEVIDAALKGGRKVAVVDGGDRADIVSTADKAGQEVYFGCDIGQGICGSLVAPPPTWYSPLLGVIGAPARPFGVFTDIENNCILTFVYRGPPVKQHQSKLLDGIYLDESILSAQDLIPRKQRVGRGQVDILQISQSTRSQEARNFGRDQYPMSFETGGRVEYDQYGRARPAPGAGLMSNSDFFQSRDRSGGYDGRVCGNRAGGQYGDRGGYGSGCGDGGRYDQPYRQPPRGAYGDMARDINRRYPPSAYGNYAGAPYTPAAGRDYGRYDIGGAGYGSRPMSDPDRSAYAGYQHSGYHPHAPIGLDYYSQGPPMSYPGNEYPIAYHSEGDRYAGNSLRGGFSHSAPPRRGYGSSFDRGAVPDRGPASFSHSAASGKSGQSGLFSTPGESSTSARRTMEYSGSRNNNQQSHVGGRPAPVQRGQPPAAAGLSTFSARNTADISSRPLANDPGSVFFPPPPVAPAAASVLRQPRDPRLRK